MERIGGIVYLSLNGETMPAKGAFTYNLGRPKRTSVMGVDGVHGYKEEAQIPFVEGKVSLTSEVTLEDLLAFEDGTVTLELPDGRSIVLRDAFFASEGQGSTEEGEVDVRFEGQSAEEVPAA